MVDWRLNCGSKYSLALATRPQSASLPPYKSRKWQEYHYNIDIIPSVRSHIQAVVTSLDHDTRSVIFPIWKYFSSSSFSNCLQAVWKYSNERIMNWMQEAARRIDISKRSFLIETISSQYVTYAFSHLYPSPPQSLCEHQRFWSF